MRRVHVCLLPLLGACQSEYPLPPTACDDYCHATQRAGCPEDYPEGCVSQCEDEGLLAEHPDCEAAFEARNDCYLAAPSSEFQCAEEGHSIPGDELCLDERRDLLACVRPEAELCLEECFRRHTICGRDHAECDAACVNQDPKCTAEERAYYLCALGNDVDCSEPSTDDRPLDEIPCLFEIGAWFDCIGWE
jgi:hypothetical protein